MNQAAHAFRSDEDVQMFLHKLRHDLGNTVRPLVEIPEWIAEDLAEEDIQMPESIQQHLDMLQTYGSRLNLMIEDLLTFAHIGNVADNTTKPVANILEELVSGTLPETFKLRTLVSTNSVPISTKDMTTLLDVLLSNCVKHHDRDGGKISVSWGQSNGVYQLTVNDDGPGIAAKDIDKIFDPLTTLESRDTVEGSGMGLTIARQVAQQYNGTIAALSPPDQRGTCIVVRFH